MELQSTIFVSSLATVLLVDRLIVNRFFPRVRFQ
jgi:hypothetical protein